MPTPRLDNNRIFKLNTSQLHLLKSSRDLPVVSFSWLQFLQCGPPQLFLLLYKPHEHPWTSSLFTYHKPSWNNGVMWPPTCRGFVRQDIEAVSGRWAWVDPMKRKLKVCCCWIPTWVNKQKDVETSTICGWCSEGKPIGFPHLHLGFTCQLWKHLMGKHGKTPSKKGHVILHQNILWMVAKSCIS